MRKIRVDWFLVGLLGVVLLAYWFPSIGATGGVLKPELTTKLGVALIFFLHGLLLPFSALRGGVLRWRVHLVIQGVTFLIFPLLGLLFVMASNGVVSGDLRLGFFYLCVLPSTVSSSIAMTALAQGNVAVAVFNATLSGVIGVALTPLWMSVMLHHAGGAMDVVDVIADLVTWLVLPLVVGQVLQPFVGDRARRHKKSVNRVDRFIILMLVYTSFCDSFLSHVWQGHGWQNMAVVVASTVLLLFVVLAGLWAACNRLHVAAADRAAIVFCGTKKSLANGVPMAGLIFAGHPGLGLILLPILMYHALQLLVCAPIAARWGREATQAIK